MNLRLATLKCVWRCGGVRGGLRWTDIPSKVYSCLKCSVSKFQTHCNPDQDKVAAEEKGKNESINWGNVSLRSGCKAGIPVSLMSCSVFPPSVIADVEQLEGTSVHRCRNFLLQPPLRMTHTRHLHFNSHFCNLKGSRHKWDGNWGFGKVVSSSQTGHSSWDKQDKQHGGQRAWRKMSCFVSKLVI